MLHLRPAVRSDVTVILSLIRALAGYEREPQAVVATEEDLLRDGFGAAPRFRVLLCEVDGAVAGFALYFFTWSTWQGRPTLFLEDLFVRPELRGQGAGLSLMRRLAKIAVEEGCTRFHWQVLDWNAPSIAFYEGLGAKILKEWQAVRLDGVALQRLAAE